MANTAMTPTPTSPATPRSNAGGKLTVEAQTLNAFDPKATFGSNLVAPFTNLEATYKTDAVGQQVLDAGDTVELLPGYAGGGTPGTTYQYTGTDGYGVDLSQADYTDKTRWTAVMPVSNAGITFVRTLSTYLDGNFGLDNNLVDSWTQATAVGQKKASIAGSVAVVFLDHEATATIRNGAKINAGATATGSQDVVVNAVSQNDTIDLGGNFQMPGIGLLADPTDIVKTKSWSPKDAGKRLGDFKFTGAGGDDTGKAVGATALVYFYTNDVAAQIEDGVTLNADTLEVTAENGTLGVAVGAAGGQSEDFGFTGVGIYNSIDDHTTASVGGRATVNLTGDATIDASDTSTLITVSGAITLSEKVGLGASIGWNQVSRDTQAFIGNRKGSADPGTGGSFTSGGAIDIGAANGGFIGSFAVAGAYAKNSDDAADNQSTAASVAVGFAHNTLADVTQAYIHHAKVTAADDITLDATATTIVEALSIGGAVARGNTNSVALAGAASTNTVQRDTQAFIKDSNLVDLRGVSSTGGGVSLTATDNTQVFSQAGAVSIAWGTGSQTSTATRSLSIGVSVAINEVGLGSADPVLAFIEDATVSADDNISASAKTESKYHALAVGGSVSVASGGNASSSSLAGAAAGAFASNLVHTSIGADIVAASDVQSSGGAVSLAADDLTTLLRADSFGIAVAYAASTQTGSSTGALAIGVGIAMNDVDGDVTALIDDSTVDAFGDITLHADEQANISALGVGVAASAARGTGATGAIAGAGSAAVNRVDNRARSAITGSIVDSSAGSVELEAHDGADVVGVAGTVALAVGLNSGSSGPTVAVAVGVSVVLNEIGLRAGQSTEAVIDDSTVTADDDLSLDALSDASIYALAAGGSGAAAGSNGSTGVTGAFAGAGVGTSNTIKQTIAATIAGSTVEATQGTARLHATDSAQITADAGAVAVALALSASGTALSGSVGVAVALNTIEGAVSATLDDSTLTAAGVDIRAESKPDPAATSANQIEALALTISAAGAFSSSSTAGALAGAGVAAVNRIDNDIQARIGADSTVLATGADGVALTAADQSTIGSTAVAAAISLGVSTGGNAGAIAVGISVALNEVDNDVLAEIDALERHSRHGIGGLDRLRRRHDPLGHRGGQRLDRRLHRQQRPGDRRRRCGIGQQHPEHRQRRHQRQHGGRRRRGHARRRTATPSSTPPWPPPRSASAPAARTAWPRPSAWQWRRTSSATTGRATSWPASLRRSGPPSTTRASARAAALSASAVADQDIDAIVVAASVAVGVGGSNGFALAGSGVFTENKIATDVKASISNDAAAGIHAGGVALTASDTSDIEAFAGAASVAVAAGGSNAVSISIGVALAHNRIDNNVEASIVSVDDLVAGTGGIALHSTVDATITATSAAASLGVGIGSTAGIAVSGAGAESTNIILSKANAFAKDSDLESAGAVSFETDMTGTIDAKVIAASVAVGAGSTAGIGVSIGVAVARNFIGWDPTGTDVAATYESAKPVVTLATNDTVRVTSGPMAGDVYRYLGATLTDGDPNQTGVQLVDLSVQNYGDASLWQHASVKQSAAQAQAYLEDTSVDATGALTIEADNDASIDAIVIAASAALALGGTAGVAVSGAGVYTENKIKTLVKAFIDGDGADTWTRRHRCGQRHHLGHRLVGHQRDRGGGGAWLLRSAAPQACRFRSAWRWPSMRSATTSAPTSWVRTRASPRPRAASRSMR